MRKRVASFFLLNSIFLLASAVSNSSYKDISGYLTELESTKSEDRRVELMKLVFDSVVSADLSDKRVVKDMTPIVEKIQMAVDSGLDRWNVGGKEKWLSASIGFFEREKLKPIIDIPESDFGGPQTASANGIKLLILPNKILTVNGESSTPLIDAENIHEAIITADGTKVAFFKTASDKTTAEIYMIRTKNKKAKKIAMLPSCKTILFSDDGESLYAQEQTTGKVKKSMIYRLSSGGGRPKPFTEGSLLQTYVANGPYKGALIVFRERVHPWGATVQECAYAVDSSGRELGRLRDGPCR